MEGNGLKNKVRGAYLEALLEELANARRGHAEAKKDTIAAEGRMVTRYDSTKTEVGWLADGFLKEVKELEQCISDTKDGVWYRDTGEIIGVDSLVKVREEDGFEYLYYLVGGRGGMELLLEEGDVYCVSVNAPIAKGMLGRRSGERIMAMPEGEMQIISVE